MALSGSYSKTVASAFVYTTSWTAKQDITNNQTTITCTHTFTLKKGSTINIGSRSHSCTVGGVKKSFTSSTIYQMTTLSSDKVYTLGTTTHIIPHNDDGTKSVDFSSSFNFNATINGTKYTTVSATSSATLDTIPRGATIVSAPDFDDEANPTITYSNPAGESVTSLDACISLTGSVDDISYRAISKTGTSYTFNLTDAERNILRNNTTGGNSRQVIFYLRTVVAGETFHSTSYKTLSLVNHTPTLSPSASVSTSSTTYTLTGSTTTFIKGYTDVSVSTGAAARKGATLTSYRITNGSKSITTTSGTISAVENGTFSFSATDNRGNTTTQTLTRSIVDYVKLTCNMTPTITVDGVATLSVSGNVFNASFGAVQNTLALQYRYRVADGTWSSWAGFNGTKSGNTYWGTATITGLDYRTKYGFQVRATDKLYTVEAPEQVIIALPVFDWGENDFNFNVPVYINEQPINDFVVEQGTSGDWSYRKWNSGIAECWARKAVSTAVNTAWGNLYVSGSLSSTNIAFPFTFKAIPMINVNLSGSGSGAFLIASGSSSSSTTQTGGYEIARGSASSTAANYAINYDVRGRWK